MIIKPITTEEENKIYKLISNEERPKDFKFGPGISVFDDDKWVVGIFFIKDDSNIIAGACEEGIKGTGIWIQYWPEMVKWAHTLYDEFIMEIEDETIADLMMKLGGSSKNQIEVEGKKVNQIIYRKK